MNVTDALLAVSGLLGGNSGGGGGGGDAVLVNKTVNANGTYLPSADNADGYKQVVVNVPGPTLTPKTITENGIYIPQDDGADGYDTVEVNVQGGVELPTPFKVFGGTYIVASDTAKLVLPVQGVSKIECFDIRLPDFESHLGDSEYDGKIAKALLFADDSPRNVGAQKMVFAFDSTSSSKLPYYSNYFSYTLNGDELTISYGRSGGTEKFFGGKEYSYIIMGR